jgi:hypothetical protein
MYLPFFIVDSSAAIMRPMAPNIAKADFKWMEKDQFSQNLNNQPINPKITPAAIPATL